MKFHERDNRYERYLPPADNRYDYVWFDAEESPEGVLLAKRIQAESYVNMQIVRPEGLITLENGDRIISPTVSNPSGDSYVALGDNHTEYVLGVEKGTTDIDPLTGRLVAWRKFYAPLDALPAYQFCNDRLSPEGERYLRAVDADPFRKLAEPEALGKTMNANPGTIKEFVRNEIQRARGTGEVWFMGLVEKTVYQSWVHNWGPSAVRQIGESKLLTNPHNYNDVALVPTVVDIDKFYGNMAYDIMSNGAHPNDPRVANFLYMSNGVSDDELGMKLTAFRKWARRVTGENDD